MIHSQLLAVPGTERTTAEEVVLGCLDLVRGDRRLLAILCVKDRVLYQMAMSWHTFNDVPFVIPTLCYLAGIHFDS